MTYAVIEGHERAAYGTLDTSWKYWNTGSPTGREPYGDGAARVV